MFHIGCCGYTTAKSKYHEALSVVELQQIFYQPPSLRVLSSWRDGAPKGFEFTLKAWQLITHETTSPTYNKLKDPVPDFKRMNYGSFRPTGEVWRAWDMTEKAAEILGVKVIVFQCPPSFKPTEENIANMRSFFGRVGRNGYIFVWEPRGNWPEAEVKRLCEELDLAHCTDPFRQAPLHGKIKYLRLQGKGGYNYKYTEADLREIVERYKDEKDVYVMFNNTNMLDDALAMKRLAEEG